MPATPDDAMEPLDLHFMRNDPVEAVMLVDIATRRARANAAFRDLVGTPTEGRFDELITTVSGDHAQRAFLRDEIFTGTFDARRPLDVRTGPRHYRLYAHRDGGVIVIHARDMAELDRVTEELSEYARGLTENTVGLEMSQREIRRQYEELQEELRKRMMAQDLLHQSILNLNRIIHEMIATISTISILRDPYTGKHQQRVAHLARSIAEELELPLDQIQTIYVAGMIHDVGKLSIPTEILSKPGKISEVEFLLIQNHPQISYEILKLIEFPWPVATIALQHHEKLDGSGYPNGIRGDEILPETKIITVADTVEAISSHRPYRAGLGIESALEEILIHRGTKYDPAAVDTCARLFREKNFDFEKDETKDLFMA